MYSNSKTYLLESVWLTWAMHLNSDKPVYLICASLVRLRVNGFLFELVTSSHWHFKLHTQMCSWVKLE